MDANFKTSLDHLIAASGGRIWIVSGDRDSATQASLYADAVAKYGEADAANWAAPPGHSNHEKGLAADLGGDLNLAHQLAPQFGIYFPLSNEEWHCEPLTTKAARGIDSASDPSAAPTTLPDGTVTAPTGGNTLDINATMQKLIGSSVDLHMFDTVQDPAFANMSTPIMKLSQERVNAPVFTTPTGGPTGIDDFMARIKQHESSGNYTAEGVPTDWGTATGAYQFLDSTWAGYGGYARAKDAPPEVQDAKARQLMQTYYNQFGNWRDVAAAWYAGPGGNFNSKEVQDYVNAVA